MKSVRLPIVRICFQDHVANTADAIDEACICEVIGVLFRADADAYYVASWIMDRTINTPNTDAYRILRSTVMSIEELTPKRRRKRWTF